MGARAGREQGDEPQDLLERLDTVTAALGELGKLLLGEAHSDSSHVSPTISTGT